MNSKPVKISLGVTLCPICYEVPPADVFQCKKGHTICFGCYKKIKRCPQCRVLLGKFVFRNRALETILDAATFTCSNANCEESLKRKDLQRHKQVCPFREVNVCPALGYKCELTVASAAELSVHLTNAHHAKPHNGYLCKRLWNNFPTDYVKKGRFQCWTDLFTSEGEKFLISTQLSFKPDNGGSGSSGVMSFAVLSLSDSPQKANEFSVTVNISTIYKSVETRASLWYGLPIHFKCLGGNSDICPCFSLPVSFLKLSLDSRVEVKELADKEVEYDVLLEVYISKATSQPSKRVKTRESNPSGDVK